MKNYTFILCCKGKARIDLRMFGHQITRIVTKFGGKNVKVFPQAYSFDWPKGELTKGQRAELGRRIAKIKGLGCYVDVYIYHRKSPRTGKPTKVAESRQLFRAVK